MPSCISKSIRNGTGLAFCLAASGASAHGFGQRFDLPLPLWLWLVGAGATLVLTFAAMAVFARRDRVAADRPRLDLLRIPVVRWLAGAGLIGLLRLVAVAIFLLTVCAGFFGSQSPYANLINTMIWVIWWVGFAFVCALVGDLWSLLNPLHTLFVWAEAAYARLSGGRALSLHLRYPRWLGAWPGVVLFFGFAWAELVWGQKDVPQRLASATAGYALLTWTGMWLYGREVWLAHGEAFAIAFGILGRFAPLGHVAPTPDSPRARLEVRPPGAGLATHAPIPLSLMVFVLLMLASVSFDGFKEIALMQKLETAIHETPALAALLFDLSEVGFDESRAVQSVTLLLVPTAFIIMFWFANWLMLRIAGAASTAAGQGPGFTATQAACAFVFTLVPIAVAYHLSHYFSLLLTAGQFIIPLASDPFGHGWNVFGTAGYKVDLALVSPYVFWYSAVLLIVAGHVIAVVLAHATALCVFGSRRAALLSQIPMLALMVGYTTLSLWILAQPIVG